MENFKRLLENASERPFKLSENGRRIYAEGREFVICDLVSEYPVDYSPEDEANARLLTIGANHVGELVELLDFAIGEIDTSNIHLSSDTVRRVQQAEALLAQIEEESSRG